MHKWINWPKSQGNASRQAHVNLPPNTYEREMGKEGFSGPATQLHHQHPPTSWTHIEGPLKPRAFDTNQLAHSINPLAAPTVLSNDHINCQTWRTNQSMSALARNADGDQLLFIHEGNAELFCDFGHMNIAEGDYLLLPRSTTWRLALTSDSLTALMIEATNDSFSLPDKGLLGEHALFDPAMLDTPQLNDTYKAQQSEHETQVIVKRQNMLSTVTYPFNPLDTTGWHGTLMPMKINWRDIRPVMSHRYHLPPSVHATFVCQRAMITTFCPRPFESDPGALKVPFYHNNNDYDEVIFYHEGEFFSRDNINKGMMTFHPCGLTHGPHPNAYKNAFKPRKAETSEVAVMIDTRDPLNVTDAATKIEWSGYVDSWKEK